MFLKNIDLTTALRPSFLPDEVLFFVQDNVGLYEGYGCTQLRKMDSKWDADTIAESTRSLTIRMDLCT
jgi:hypothetical protein